MTIVIAVVAAILVFGVVIFCHELGHFVVAKKSGIKVNEFALGMGPALFKFGKGETTYSLRALPIGGFVSMEGEDEESDEERSYQKAPVYKRILVIVAGAFMNFVLGFLAITILVIFSEYPIISRQVAQVDSAASGLQVDDVITKINGRTAFIFADLDYEFARTQNGTFSLEVERGGETVLLENVTFDTQIAYDQETGEPIINDYTGEPYEYLDLGFKVYGIEKTFTTVISEAFGTTLSYARLIYLTVFDLIVGRAAINSLSGPIGIVTEIGKAAMIGWQPVVQMLALISINLGVVNMLPLPILDGGKTVLLIIEGIRRKPLAQKYETIINIVGLVLVVALFIFVSFNDITRLIS